MDEKITLQNEEILDMAKKANDITEILQEVLSISSKNLEILAESYYGLADIYYGNKSDGRNEELNKKVSLAVSSYSSGFPAHIGNLISYYQTLSQYIIYSFKQLNNSDEKMAKQMTEQAVYDKVYKQNEIDS